MRGPTISVVIPAYRAARTIGRALGSVFSQSHQPEEIIVVDDGSPDDLIGALSQYGDRVTLIQKPNGGAASARNLGIERSRGDLIAFLDADDYWEPEKLERQLAIFNIHPELGLVAGDYFSAKPGHPRAIPLANNDRLTSKVLRAQGSEAMEVATWIWTSMVLVHRDMLRDQRFVPGLEPAEDRDLWFRLVELGPVYLCAEPLATNVQEPGSLSRSSVDIDCGNMLKVVRRHGDRLGKHGLCDWEARALRRWAANHLGQGHPRQAIQPAWARIRRQPLSLEAWWIVVKSSLAARID